jgi:hypothetical protein
MSHSRHTLDTPLEPRGYQLGYQGCLEVAKEEDGTRKNAVSNVFPLVEVARFELTTT